MTDRTQMQRLIKDLDSPSSEVRRDSVIMLAELLDVTSTPLLVRMMRDSNPGVRASIRIALSRFGAGVVPYILELFTDSDWRDHHPLAMTILTDIGEPAASAMEELLDSPNQEIRNLAALGLSKLGRDSVVEVLIEALTNPKPFTDKALYIEQLGNLRDTRATDPLCRELQSGQLGDKLAAARALGQIGSASAIPALIEALQDTNEHLAARSADSLGTMNATEAVETLTRIVNDDKASHLLRQASIAALGAIGDRRATEIIVQQLLKFDQMILYPKHVTLTDTAAKTLGELQDSRAVPALIQALQEAQFSAVQWYAAEALGKIGDERAKEHLSRHLGSTECHHEFALASVTLGEVAAQALEQIEARYTP